MGIRDSHQIVMKDGERTDISQEMFEIVSNLLQEKEKPEFFKIGDNIIFTRFIMAIRRKGEWKS